MKTSLSHLPKDKQAELKAQANKIRNEFDGIEMIILFGSFARGDWKDEAYTKDNVFYQYKSDFNILVIVNDPKTGKNNRKWESLERKLQKEDFLFMPLSLMGYDINHVNQKLSDGDDFSVMLRKRAFIFTTRKTLSWIVRGSLSRRNGRSSRRMILKSGMEVQKNFSIHLMTTRKKDAIKKLHLNSTKRPNVITLLS